MSRDSLLSMLLAATMVAVAAVFVALAGENVTVRMRRRMLAHKALAFVRHR